MLASFFGKKNVMDWELMMLYNTKVNVIVHTNKNKIIYENRRLNVLPLTPLTSILD